MTIVVNGLEELLADAVVCLDIFGLMRAAVNVEANPQPGEVRRLPLVVASREFSGRDTFLTSGYLDRYAVVIAAADEADVIALRPQIAHVDVGGQIGPGNVTDVQAPVGIGQCGGYEKSALHGVDSRGARRSQQKRCSAKSRYLKSR